MDASERGAMMLVRFVAAGLICISLAELALAFAIGTKTGVPVSALSFILKSLPALAGVIMLFRAKALAQWIANLLDG